MAVESKSKNNVSSDAEELKVEAPVVSQSTDPVPSEDTGTSSVEPAAEAGTPAEAVEVADVEVQSKYDDYVVFSVAGNDYAFEANAKQYVPADKVELLVEQDYVEVVK